MCSHTLPNSCSFHCLVCQQFWLAFLGFLTFNNLKFFFIFLRVQCFIEHVAKEGLSKGRKPISSSDSSDASSFTPTLSFVGAGPPAGAQPPAPSLQRRAPMLMLIKVFANKPGQKGPTFTLASSMRALILPYTSGTASSCRMRVRWMQLRDRPWSRPVLGGRLPRAVSTRPEGPNPTLPWLP